MSLKKILSVKRQWGDRVSLSGDIEDPREETQFLGTLDEFFRQLLLVGFYISCTYEAQESTLNILVA